MKSKKILDRLCELHKDVSKEAEYDREEQEYINLKSLELFLFFINFYNVDVPSITITYEGYIKALWRKDDDNRVSVHFLDSGEINKCRIVAFHENSFGEIVRYTEKMNMHTLYTRHYNLLKNN